MIWFVTDEGDGDIKFQIPPEGIAVGDHIHMVEGPRSGGRYMVVQVRTLPNRYDPSQSQKHLGLEPADENTARLHPGWSYHLQHRGKVIAKSQALKVRYV